jgi:methyl-accepting chemotaxis protein
MREFTRLPEVRARLAAITGFAILAFAVYGFYCFDTINQVKINGPQYQRIALGNRLVADILPPQEFLVETYLTAFEMLEADGEELDARIGKARLLMAQFRARSAYWDSALSDASQKRILADLVVRHGNGMIGILENEFIPALRMGERAKAQALLRGTIRTEFREHRAGVDSLARAALRENGRNEAVVARMVKRRALGQVLIGGLMVLFLATTCFRLVCRCETRLKNMVVGILTGVIPVSREIRDKMIWN